MIHPAFTERVDPLLSATFRPEAEELDALVHELSAPRGFAFLVGSVTTRSHRQRLEKDLIAGVARRQRGRRLLRLELKEPIASLLSVLSAVAAEQQPDAILLSGIEGCFAELFSRRGQQVLEQLEADRERLAREVACPVLIWLPVPLMYAMVLYAGSLFQAAAKVYLFAEHSVDMFCLENFLRFAAEHSMALERSVRTELLLDVVEPQQLVAAVSRTATGKELADRGRLLKFE